MQILKYVALAGEDSELSDAAVFGLLFGGWAADASGTEGRLWYASALPIGLCLSAYKLAMRKLYCTYISS